jgi:two-component system sensor histidine kinase KdpD
MEKLNRFGGYLFGANTLAEAAGQIVAGLHVVFGLTGARLSLEDSSHSWGEGEVDGPPVSVVPIPVGGCTFEIYGTRLSDEVLHLLYGMIAQVIVRARNSEEKSRLEAEQKGESLRSTVLNALAHSFRTPLTSIKMAASMLRSDDFVSVPDQKDLIAAIDEEASRLDQLIGESLDLARLEYRRSNPRRELCSVSSITGRVIARMNRHFGRREVVVEVPEDLPPIVGDPFLFEQMLIQVVDNAWKYSRPGSQIRISAEATGSSVNISVRNQGSEILPSEQARIFDKFYRGSEFQSTVEGTGLGLAIAKTIAEACHGRIWLESEPSGPAFHFALPLGAQ